MIYFLQAQHLVKIGYAFDVKKRQAVLQLNNPIELILLGYMEGDKKLERRIHQFFKENRHRGEWFHLTNEIKDYIRKNCTVVKKTTKAKLTGKVQGRKKPFTFEQIKSIEINILSQGNVRDHALLRIAVDTMLRSSDILSLKIGDVLYNNKVMNEINVFQKKTRQPIKCYILDKAQEAIQNYVDKKFAVNKSNDTLLFNISDKQYRNIVKGWATSLGLNPAHYSSHSLRRTKPTEIYRRTNNLEVVRQLLGQKSLGATSAYLGVTEDDVYHVISITGDVGV